MTRNPKPAEKPRCPHFSSGPAPKPPGWSTSWLDGALVGRSHRAPEGRARLAALIAATRRLLEVPEAFRIAIVPGSDTGAFELALWNLLGSRGVDVLAWEVFGKSWVRDIVGELRLDDVRVIEADFGALPDLHLVDPDRDVVFTQNGTTSGVCIPDFDWISDSRRGLTLVDATSAVFAHPVDWPKVDALTFSWQKALGGEAAHGMLILSERAAARLAERTPAWPVPKLFRIASGGMIDEALFEGHTINTPSMLAVEDFSRCLAWAEAQGGLPGLMARAAANSALVYDWADRVPWVAALPRAEATRSKTSVCLEIIEPAVAALDREQRAAFVSDLVERLAAEGVAFDIGSHRSAPPGLRIWTGPTVEKKDLACLLPWLEWSFAESLSRVSSLKNR